MFYNTRGFPRDAIPEFRDTSNILKAGLGLREVAGARSNDMCSVLKLQEAS